MEKILEECLDDLKEISKGYSKEFLNKVSKLIDDYNCNIGAYAYDLTDEADSITGFIKFNNKLKELKNKE